MTRKLVLLILLVAVLLPIAGPMHADGCDPTAGQACEMPAPRERWTDVDYLPLVTRSNHDND